MEYCSSALYCPVFLFLFCYGKLLLLLLLMFSLLKGGENGANGCLHLHFILRVLNEWNVLHGALLKTNKLAYEIMHVHGGRWIRVLLRAEITSFLHNAENSSWKQ